MQENSEDVVTLLKADHQKVERLFSRVDTISLEGLEDYFCELREELVRHEIAEELIVYPAFRKSVPGADATADACIKEQSEAEEKLASLEKQDSSTESFRMELKTLREAVLRHAQHEEREVLPPLATNNGPDELQRLGEKYEKALKAVPTHPHPHAPDTPPGNMAVGPIAAMVDKMRDAMRRAA